MDMFLVDNEGALFIMGLVFACCLVYCLFMNSRARSRFRKYGIPMDDEHRKRLTPEERDRWYAGMRDRKGK